MSCQEVRVGQGVLDTSDPDAVIAALADRQHGMVSYAQLLDAGLGRGGVEHRIRHGRLFPFHRGVYVVGRPPPGPRGFLWGAVLACGLDTNAVTHRSGAWAHGLVAPPGLPIHLTTWGESRSRDGVRVHRSASFDPTEDVVRIDGLPTATVARLLLDLATSRDIGRLCRSAHHLNLLDVRAISGVLARAPNHRGARRLEQAVEALTHDDPEDMTRRELEALFLELVIAAGLPTPRVNAPLFEFVVDFLWPGHRLVVETDGAQTHLTPWSFAEDRARDRRLTAAGYRVVRFTWREVAYQPRQVARELRRLLGVRTRRR